MIEWQHNLADRIFGIDTILGSITEWSAGKYREEKPPQNLDVPIVSLLISLLIGDRLKSVILAAKSFKSERIKMNMNTVAQNVRNGAKWLDENYPGWYNKILLKKLRMSSYEHCILGQVDEDYPWSGYSGDHGFNTIKNPKWTRKFRPYCMKPEYWEMLNKMWTIVVNSKREFDRTMMVS